MKLILDLGKCSIRDVRIPVIARCRLSPGVDVQSWCLESPQFGKFWVVVDAMRLNRTDTALVRAVVPIVKRDEAAAFKSATDFVRSFYSTLRQYLPA